MHVDECLCFSHSGVFFSLPCENCRYVRCGKILKNWKNRVFEWFFFELHSTRRVLLCLPDNLSNKVYVFHGLEGWYGFCPLLWKNVGVSFCQTKKKIKKQILCKCSRDLTRDWKPLRGYGIWRIGPNSKIWPRNLIFSAWDFGFFDFF